MTKVCSSRLVNINNQVYVAETPQFYILFFVYSFFILFYFFYWIREKKSADFVHIDFDLIGGAGSGYGESLYMYDLVYLAG